MASQSWPPAIKKSADGWKAAERVRPGKPAAGSCCKQPSLPGFASCRILTGLGGRHPVLHLQAAASIRSVQPVQVSAPLGGDLPDPPLLRIPHPSDWCKQWHDRASSKSTSLQRTRSCPHLARVQMQCVHAVPRARSATLGTRLESSLQRRCSRQEW